VRLQIEETAEKLLADLGISEIPVPVEAVATSQGMTVTRLRSEGSESGFAMSRGSVQVIGVNKSHSFKRQRFTIAHEIGHLLMHHQAGDSLIVDNTVRVNFRDDLSSLATNEQEIEANAFAAALLMPRSLVLREVRAAYSPSTNYNQLVTDLARRFNVSAEAMGFRLLNLGLASA